MKEKIYLHNKRRNRQAEDILKMIYKLEQKGDRYVKLSLIAQHFDIKEKRVEKCLKILLVHNYIQRNSTDNFTITDVGKQKAIDLVRKHRVYERYLAERTGYPATDWHKKAEVMEHKLTKDDFDELDKKLGNPVVDPHGAPIPSETGHFKATKGVSLIDFPIGVTARVINLEDEPEEVFKTIHDYNIHLRTILKITDKKEDIIVVECHKETFSLSNIVAKNIFVKEYISIDDDTVNTDKIYRLTSLKPGEEGLIIGIADAYRGASRRRLLDLGFVKGSTVSIDLVSPMKNPVAYLVRGTSIALREDQAKFILINKIYSEDDK